MTNIIAEMKKSAKIHGYMAMIAEDIVNEICERDDSDELNAYNNMKPWDISFDPKCGIPIMAVPAKYCGEETVGYLMPFRGYRFQVCGDRNGSCDMGSTIVCRLADFAHEEDGKCDNGYVLQSFAELAAYKAGCPKMTCRQLAKLDAFVTFCIEYLNLKQ